MVPFAALLQSPSPALAQVSLGAAESFAVLGGTAVTCTNSIVTGDVGVYPGTAVTQTNCTINGTVNTYAAQASTDFLLAYDALAAKRCDQVLTATTLGSQTFSPGVYCFQAALTLTDVVLTLNGPADGIWIFKIGTLGTGALTGTRVSVVMAGGGETCNNNVFWWTAEAATLTDSFFLGNILAGAAITVTGGSLDGQALAKAAVTLTDTDVSVCGTRPHPPIKVTGGGQIPVPDPVSPGRASFGFNAQPNTSGGGAKGDLNYLNHVTGLHVNGPVTKVEVIAINPDGSPKTVRFSGTCRGSSPSCSFSVTVEDHGEPGTSDQFGITVTGGLSEARSQRVISNGNIQFHRK